MTYALQLYSVRDAAEQDLSEALGRVAALGYAGVEFAGFFRHSAKEVRDMLTKHGLTPVGSHVSLDMLAPDAIEQTADFHKQIGCYELTVPAVDWNSREKATQNLQALTVAAHTLRQKGIRLSFHNHAKECIPAPYGTTVMEELLRTELYLEPDIFWLYAAGVDPVAFCEAHRDRICMLHLKDGVAAPRPLVFESANRNTVDRALGEGNAPVLPALTWAKEHGVPVIVESEGLDPTGLDEVARCMSYLQNLNL